MTVAELLSVLKDCPPELEVRMANGAPDQWARVDGVQRAFGKPVVWLLGPSHPMLPYARKP